MRHQTVPVATNVNPSATNARTFVSLLGSMNCGINARKNKATFGLRTFVSTPARNAPSTPALRARGITGSVDFALVNIPIPK